MKVLIYSHFFPPETGAAALRMHYFVEALRTSGVIVKVINPIPNYPKGKINSGLKRFFYRDKSKNIIYLPIYVPKKDSKFKRLLSYCSYFVSSFVYLLFSRFNPSIIISSSPPIFTAFAAALFSKIKGSLFILDVRDIWPDIGIELGIVKNNLIIKILMKIEKFITFSATAIIVTANGDKNNLIKKGIPEEKFTVIYNGADVSVFHSISELEKINIRKKYNLPVDKRIIIYFGSFNFGMNDIEVLGDALIMMENQKDKFYFLSVGDGNKKEEFLAKLRGKIYYSHINSLNSVEVAALVSSSDISVIPRKYIKSDTGGNLPVKCFESWACGVPVLLSTINNSEIAKIFSECGAGKIIEPGNAELMKDTLLKLINSENLKNIGAKGKVFVQNNYNRKEQAEKLINIINKIKILL